MKYGVIEFECHAIEYHDTVHNAEEVLSKEQVMNTNKNEAKVHVHVHVCSHVIIIIRLQMMVVTSKHIQTQTVHSLYQLHQVLLEVQILLIMLSEYYHCMRGGRIAMSFD